MMGNNSHLRVGERCEPVRHSDIGQRSYSLSRNLVSLSTRRAIQKSYNVGLIAISKSYMINVIQFTRHSCIGTIPRNLVSDQRTHQAMTCLRPRQKEHPMLDVVMLALGLGFFGVSVSYAYACERL
jgi:hypothetical protein